MPDHRSVELLETVSRHAQGLHIGACRPCQSFVEQILASTRDFGILGQPASIAVVQ